MKSFSFLKWREIVLRNYVFFYLISRFKIVCNKHLFSSIGATAINNILHDKSGYY
uniref:Uncharacterized protein n=1 Tax=Kuenenia stuttgartiensis TaxID=174633 RepID=Q1PXL0_KUEST|nr:unknown protein [Candidatus Kuenenia stuttgartiensis]